MMTVSRMQRCHSRRMPPAAKCDDSRRSCAVRVRRLTEVVRCLCATTHGDRALFVYDDSRRSCAVRVRRFAAAVRCPCATAHGGRLPILRTNTWFWVPSHTLSASSTNYMRSYRMNFALIVGVQEGENVQESLCWFRTIHANITSASKAIMCLLVYVTVHVPFPLFAHWLTYF